VFNRLFSFPVVVWIFLSSGIGVPGLGSFLSFPVIRLECKGRTGYPTYNPTLGRLLGLQAFPRLIFSLLHLVDIWDWRWCQQLAKKVYGKLEGADIKSTFFLSGESLFSLAYCAWEGGRSRRPSPIREESSAVSLDPGYHIGSQVRRLLASVCCLSIISISSFLASLAV
jgi:hypothetical protein